MVLHRVIACLGLTIGSLLGEEDDWAYRSIETPQLPSVKNTAWPSEDLDHFILSGIEKANYRPTKNAEKITLVRRAHLDLHGLPPTTEQINAFLADVRDAAGLRLLDELLKPPRDGERRGRHCLDAPRHSYTNGTDEHITHPPPSPHRHHASKALHND
ncbi:MAG: DUF1549 domain-containing protein, partial [Verrucomicrobiaceae bacterium]|nr:DUF1549 domain-containing protein [Verrucomicrobiaceae bacterium]